MTGSGFCQPLTYTGLFTERLAVMYAGTLAEIASVGDLFREPLHPYTQLLISSLPTHDHYRQLLRLVYRLIFLFVAEDRNLLLVPAADAEARVHYERYYSARRLREMTQTLRGTIHGDLYRGLSLVFRLVSEGYAPLDRLRSELEPLLRPRGLLQLELRRGLETQAVIKVPTGAEAISVPGIVPGEYRLTLRTGRLIWEGMILPEQVLWAEAYPGRDLKMAAQTAEVEQEATHVESLLGGELELRLCPGLEAGTMRIVRPQSVPGTQEEA